MKLKFKIFHGFIQLVSLVLLSTLVQSKAEQTEATTSPQLCLEVGSDQLAGFDRTIKVTLSNTSVAVVDPAKYRLAFREKNGKPLSIYSQNTTGNIVELASEKPLALTALLGTEMLPTEQGSKTFSLMLLPDKGVSHAELSLFIEDAQGRTVSKPLSVTWRTQPFWTPQKILTYVVGGAVITLAIIGGLSHHFKGGDVATGVDPEIPPDGQYLCDPGPSGATSEQVGNTNTPPLGPNAKGKRPIGSKAIHIEHNRKRSSVRMCLPNGTRYEFNSG
ncbi:MAG: hypothetical protein AAF400_01110 [Bacteroidota bacterium]